MAVLSATITEKRHGAKLVLAGLDLSVAAGEFVAITGPSGCGKTTLLNILAGLDRTFSGQVRAQGPMGMVFQEPRLLPWRSVADNIALAAPQADVERALRDVGLDGQGGLYPRQLSLGMARRAALARALAIQPAILLLDEPTVSLDADNAERVRRLIQAAWRQRGCAVVLVSHDTAEISRMAQRVICLPSGAGRPAPQG